MANQTNIRPADITQAKPARTAEHFVIHWIEGQAPAPMKLRDLVTRYQNLILLADNSETPVSVSYTLVDQAAVIYEWLLFVAGMRYFSECVTAECNRWRASR